MLFVVSSDGKSCALCNNRLIQVFMVDDIGSRTDFGILGQLISDKLITDYVKAASPFFHLSIDISGLASYNLLVSLCKIPNAVSTCVAQYIDLSYHVLPPFFSRFSFYRYIWNCGCKENGL